MPSFDIPHHEFKIAGAALLVAAVLWIFVAFALALRKQAWWKLGIPAVFISQTLTLLYSTSIVYGTIVTICVIILIALSFSKERFTHRVQREVKELLSSSNIQSTPFVTEASINELPEIVQKWLRRSNIIGTPQVRTARIKQKGMMRTRQNGKWMEMRAEQLVITERPGFIWSASICAAPYVFIKGRDLYKDGKGNMIIKVLNNLTIAKSIGPEIDQGSLMRYLAEIIWLPSAALSDLIRWEYVNPMAARAVLRDGKNTVSGLFTFDQHGDVISFDGKRYGDFNDRYSLETWSIKVIGYKEFNGVRIANKCDVTWKLKTGDFHWLTVEITDINYNLSTAKRINAVEKNSLPTASHGEYWRTSTN